MSNIIDGITYLTPYEVGAQGHRFLELMGELSEDAYSAGWCIDLEYNVWEKFANETGDRLCYDDQYADELEVIHELAQELELWPVFLDNHGERFVSLEDWAVLRRLRRDRNYDCNKD